MSEFKGYDSIFKKTMLVTSSTKWTNIEQMMMHVASIDDNGAMPSQVNQNSKELIEDGFTPVLVKVSIRLTVEVVESKNEVTGEPNGTI